MAYLRDTIPSIIQIDSRTIRAGRGLAELLERPSLTMPACYGLLRKRSKRGGTLAPDQDVNMDGGEGEGSTLQGGQLALEQERPLSDYLIGTALDEAIAASANPEGEVEAVDVFWPWAVEDEEELVGSTSRKRKSKQVDWRGREAILNYVFFTHFALSASTNFTTLLLIPPPTPSLLSPPHRAEYCRIAFESLNTPAFAILEAPLAAVYGVGAPNSTGMVVHLGQKKTEVNVVVDSVIRYDAGLHVDVGEDDCVEFLAGLLVQDESIPGGGTEGAPGNAVSTKAWIERTARELNGDVEVLSRTKLMDVAKEVARVIIFHEGSIVVPTMAGGHVHAEVAQGEEEEEEGVLNVAKILSKDDAAKTLAQIKESAKSKKSIKEQQAAIAAAAAQKAADEAAAAKAERERALDLVTCKIPALGDRQITVGPIRHRACEPLMVGKPEGGRTIPEAMAMAAESVEAVNRQQVWDGLVFCGELAEIPSLSLGIVSYLTPYLLTDEENESEIQPNRVRMLRIPDYFAHFKGRQTDLAPFLGACLAAKLIFSDNAATSCVSKLHYNQYGPAAIHMAMLE